MKAVSKVLHVLFFVTNEQTPKRMQQTPTFTVSNGCPTKTPAAPKKQKQKRQE